MRRVYQEASHDCLRACLASIFDMPLRKVPDTAPPPGPPSSWSQHNIVSEWLAGYNLSLWMIDRAALEGRSWPFPIGCWYIGSGVSPRDPDGYHAVVMQNGKIIHDPHPDNDMTLARIDLIEVVVAKGSPERELNDPNRMLDAYRNFKEPRA